VTVSIDPDQRPSALPALARPGFAPSGDARAAYETHGVSLVRYLARRTAKTRLLLHLPDLLDDGRTADALALVGIFAAAAATSFGRGYRQPAFDPTGTEIAETDPETGATIVARLEARGPASHLRLSVRAMLDGVGTFEGHEEILGTTVGIHGLGMPAPSVFTFSAERVREPWSARAIGTITSELAPRLGGVRIRGHGTLDLSSSSGDRGRVALDRDGHASVSITDGGGRPMADRWDLLRRR
jgi:hypothetical protein